MPAETSHPTSNNASSTNNQPSGSHALSSDPSGASNNNSVNNAATLSPSFPSVAAARETTEGHSTPKKESWQSETLLLKTEFEYGYNRNQNILICYEGIRKIEVININIDDIQRNSPYACKYYTFSIAQNCWKEEMDSNKNFQELFRKTNLIINQYANQKTQPCDSSNISLNAHTTATSNPNFFVHQQTSLGMSNAGMGQFAQNHNNTPSPTATAAAEGEETNDAISEHNDKHNSSNSSHNTTPPSASAAAAAAAAAAAGGAEEVDHALNSQSNIAAASTGNFASMSNAQQQQQQSPPNFFKRAWATIKGIFHWITAGFFKNEKGQTKGGSGSNSYSYDFEFEPDTGKLTLTGKSHRLVCNIKTDIDHNNPNTFALSSRIYWIFWTNVGHHKVNWHHHKIMNAAQLWIVKKRSPSTINLETNNSLPSTLNHNHIVQPQQYQPQCAPRLFQSTSLPPNTISDSSGMNYQ